MLHAVSGVGKFPARLLQAGSNSTFVSRGTSNTTGRDAADTVSFLCCRDVSRETVCGELPDRANTPMFHVKRRARSVVVGTGSRKRSVVCTMWTIQCRCLTFRCVCFLLLSHGITIDPFSPHDVLNPQDHSQQKHGDSKESNSWKDECKETKERSGTHNTRHERSGHGREFGLLRLATGQPWGFSHDSCATSFF